MSVTCPLNASLEELLVSGSDNRLLPASNGLNPYGCAARPRSAIPFGNCTASSPTRRGINAARATLTQLRRASRTAEEAHRICRTQRQQLKTLLHLPAEVQVALAPSGTDVELLVLALAAGHGNRPIVNVVVGPTEVGSGTPLAAACRHYDTLLPSGRIVDRGVPVCEQLAARTTVRAVDIRTSSGQMLCESEIDALVTEIVAREVHSGAQVVLHLVAHSKTGMHAPSLACVDRISKHLGEDVTVVIDAAQGRVSRRGLQEILASGHLVMFTGSKFYGGPPFSGALLVPPRWNPLCRSVKELPDGFADYFTAAELPDEWAGIRRGLPNRINIGSMLRWSAALAEMRAYYDVPSDTRLQILRSFEEAVPRLFGDRRELQLLPVFPPVTDDSQTRLLESKTTVFAFRVSVDGRFLGQSAMRELHRELNTDVSAAYAEYPEVATSAEFHLGQPVAFGDGSAALRIALGGELIVRIATDRQLGERLPDRLEWLRGQLSLLRAKLSLLVAERSKPVAADVLT